MEKIEELKSMLGTIQKALDLYNELNPEEKMTMTPQIETKDVSDVFVCVYNDKHVGLFKTIDWTRRPDGSDPQFYDAGIIYIGLDSSYIGLKTTHHNWHRVNRWERMGAKAVFNGKIYLANCHVQNVISFDDMRTIMYNKGKIGTYELGKSNSKEMLDVLNYAYEHYQLEQKTNISEKFIKLITKN